MRCPDCNRFASFATDEDPEVDDPTIEDGEIQCQVMIRNSCDVCGLGLTEATFEL